MKDRSNLDLAAILVVLLSVGATVAIGIACSGAWKLQLGTAVSPEMSPMLLLGLGIVLGLISMRAFIQLSRGAAEGSESILFYVIWAVLAASLAARLDGVPFVTILLVVLLGLGGFIALFHAVKSIDRGDTLGAENHWGGLGNGLGGWRLTSASSLVLLAIFFCSASVALAILSRAIRVDAPVAQPSASAPAGSGGGTIPSGAASTSGR